MTEHSETAERGGLAAIVAARNEADRIAATVTALRGAFPAATIWVADNASGDGTAEAAMAAGAQVVSRGRPHGKGANVIAHHVEGKASPSKITMEEVGKAFKLTVKDKYGISVLMPDAGLIPTSTSTTPRAWR